MYGDGVAYLTRLLEEHGPLTAQELEQLLPDQPGSPTWSSYFVSALHYCVDRGKFEFSKITGKYSLAKEYHVPKEQVHQDTLEYCEQCFHLRRKLELPKKMREGKIRMCPACGGVNKIEWPAAHAYCAMMVHHYQKMKDQIEWDCDD